MEYRHSINPCPLTLSDYKKLKTKHRTDLKLAKSSHTSSKFNMITNDSKATHRLSAELLGRKVKYPLPNASPVELPLLFSNYFSNKLDSILNSLPVPTSDSTRKLTESTLSTFSNPTITQIVSLINIAKSCSSLDPLPIKITHQIFSTLAPLLLKIFIQSITSGTVPVYFKKAIITPVLKKPNLDSLNTANYRPISNLSTHSKILERVIASQLTDYLDDNNILHPIQSAYTPRKSTETALTKITSDLLSTLDNTNGTILVLLDMSAAFDTLDHDILLHRLSSIGITGLALQWFQSYLHGRTSSVCINNNYSPSHMISHGVPQGSVLGPILFNIYLLPLFNILDKHKDISFHTYADDIQIYLKCNDDPSSAPDKLTKCITDIHNWLNTNSLRLNPAKSESIFLHLPYRSNHIEQPPLIQSGSIPIVYSDKVRNL